MLAMTKEAVDAVERIVARPGVPDTAVVRIATDDSHGNGSGPVREVQIEVLPQPRAQDLLVQEMRLTVEPKSLAFLDDKVLDADLAGDEIEFRIYPQPSGS